MILIFQVLENATQCLHNLVGNTQSNISIHLYIHSTKSSGVHTHIKYLGLFIGRLSFNTSSILYISTFGSHTDNHQIAIHGVSSFHINSADSFLKSSNVTH
ncbi:MAG: hypothetical protein Q8S84_05745 [bacterium]|nr:hypothetical protein [bacterium]